MTSNNIYPSAKVLPYVYQCIHKITGEFYIGYREANKLPSHEDFPRYRTSSKKVRPRFEEFDWYIVAEFFDSDSAHEFEQLYIYENWDNELLLNGNCTYNSTTKFKLNYNVTAETKRKMSLAKVGKPRGQLSQKTKEKMSNSQKGNKNSLGHKHSNETKEKISKSKRGKPRSENTKIKISAALKGKQNTLGYLHTDETKEKMSAAKKGNPMSEETKLKISETIRKKRQSSSFSS